MNEQLQTSAAALRMTALEIASQQLPDSLGLRATELRPVLQNWFRPYGNGELNFSEIRFFAGLVDGLSYGEVSIEAESGLVEVFQARQEPGIILHCLSKNSWRLRIEVNRDGWPAATLVQDAAYSMMDDHMKAALARIALYLPLDSRTSLAVTGVLYQMVTDAYDEGLNEGTFNDGEPNVAGLPEGDFAIRAYAAVEKLHYEAGHKLHLRHCQQDGCLQIKDLFEPIEGMALGAIL